ncbi:nucleotidyl transferase AbiEii/AbiGii toxin family protein [Kineococcus sp. LSe6-4]|uniref:Nucleotidyl transferase AbiEii/AbiGii toxin family protein n=1 Tax=Kineococcus halophytocola TaxID=3234027 RepID=A0ABV4H505_9ACTN
MTGRPAPALRASLDAKLLATAQQRAVDVNRLRRHLTFQRMLRRLVADGGWVLKGGYLLEARLGARARATRDMDLTSAVELDGSELRDAVADALAEDVDGDGFVFRVTAARAHLAGEQFGAGAHLSVAADLAGRPFASVRLDVVARPGEVAGGTEDVELVPVVEVADWEPVVVPAVDLGQHLAEKLHALSAVDAHPRPSTRVKDLLDVELLLTTAPIDEAHAARRLSAVFRARDGGPPPLALPEPPAAWRADYAALTGRLDLDVARYDDALAAVNVLYGRLLTLTRPSPPEDHR